VLQSILERSQKLNFLGNPPIEDHIRNAKGFANVIHGLAGKGQKGRIYDLGSGGGVPALILIEEFKDWEFVLIERKKKRANFLHDAISLLNASERVEIVCDEAENAARNEKFASGADFVTARSFGPPSTTAECACRLLKLNAFLIVSEPPINTDRWVHENLSLTGLNPLKQIKFGDSTFQVLKQSHDPSDNLPRRAGVTRKRPLW
tara:strand:+ start:142 stop:756 length:615 start_codon:yes stop_codon:yes gene_type:complete